MRKTPTVDLWSPCAHIHVNYTQTQHTHRNMYRSTQRNVCVLYTLHLHGIFVHLCIFGYIIRCISLCIDFSEEGRACSIIALRLIVLAWLPPLPTSFFPGVHKIFLPFISCFSSAAPGEYSMSPGLVSRLNPALRGRLSFYLPLWVWVCKNQSNISTICLD